MVRPGYGADSGGEIGAEHLDGDQTVVLQVPGEEDDRHPPAADLVLDLVAAGEAGLEALQGVH